MAYSTSFKWTFKKPACYTQSSRNEDAFQIFCPFYLRNKILILFNKAMFPAQTIHFLASTVAKNGHVIKLWSIRLKREVFGWLVSWEAHILAIYCFPLSLLHKMSTCWWWLYPILDYELSLRIKITSYKCEANERKSCFQFSKLAWFKMSIITRFNMISCHSQLVPTTSEIFLYWKT